LKEGVSKNPSALGRPHQNGNDGHNQQKMNETTGMIAKESDQPSDYEDYGDNVK
jgi:hypothetical protein